MPGIVTMADALAAVKLLGPVHLKVDPFVDDVPLMMTFVFKQVSGPSLDAWMLAGGVMFCVTGVMVVAVHPFWVLVTTRV